MSKPNNNNNNNNDKKSLKKDATAVDTQKVADVKPLTQAVSVTRSADGHKYRSTAIMQPNTQANSNSSFQVKQFGQQISKGPQSRVKPIVKMHMEKKQDLEYIEWDGLSPLNTYSSSKYTPKEMIKHCENAFKSLVNKHDIDYEQYSEFVFEGRSYSINGELQFRITIFGPGKDSEKGVKSEVEIRRMAGDCFAFGEAESKFIDQLLDSKVIDEDQGGVIGKLEKGSFELFGFSSSPLPFDLETDSDTTTAEEFDEKLAEEMVKDACNKTQFQDSYLLACQDLLDACKNKEQIKILVKVDNIISKILDSIKADCYDAFAIKTLLDCVEILKKNGSKFDRKSWDSSLISIQNRWSKTVINKIGAAEFKFPKSQVVVKKCDALIFNKKK